MHLLIFDVSHHGHRTQYASHIIRAVSKLPVRITFATGEDAPASAPFGAYLEPLREHFRLETLPRLEPKPGLLRSGGTLKQLRQVVREIRPDHVFVPYADGVAQLAGLEAALGRRVIPRALEAEALLFRGRWVYERGAWIQRVKGGLSRWTTGRSPFTRLHHLDPYVYEDLLRRGGMASERLRLMPEPTESDEAIDAHAARRIFGLPADARVISAVGLLDLYKGVDLAIRAFLRLPDHSNVRMLLAGPCRPAIRDVLRGPARGLVESRRIVVQDRFLSAPEMVAAIAASDVVLAAYPRHIGSSSIVVRAARGGRPVLGGAFGWIGETVRTFKLGWSVDVQNEELFAHAMHEALAAANRYVPSEGARRFAAFHSAENFGWMWTRRLRERLGISDAEPGTDWDWVRAAVGEVPG